MHITLNNGKVIEIDIPHGYSVITAGFIQTKDLMWDEINEEFQRDDLCTGDPVADYHCVIRWTGTGSRVDDAIHAMSDSECRRMLSEIWHCFYLPDGNPVPDDDGVVTSDTRDMLHRIKIGDEHD